MWPFKESSGWEASPALSQIRVPSTMKTSILITTHLREQASKAIASNFT